MILRSFHSVFWCFHAFMLVLTLEADLSVAVGLWRSVRMSPPAEVVKLVNCHSNSETPTQIDKRGNHGYNTWATSCFLDILVEWFEMCHSIQAGFILLLPVTSANGGFVVTADKHVHWLEMMNCGNWSTDLSHSSILGQMFLALWLNSCKTNDIPVGLCWILAIFCV